MVLESFRPGVLDRLGVGYERMREVNPGIVYCAISGYGRTGPKREASGHDMNYLGLVGLLGLTGERRWPAGAGRRADRRPRRRRADGRVRDPRGAARAGWAPARPAPAQRSPGAVASPGGEVAAPARTGSGEGQVVDVSMADGALSWLAMVAAAYFADGNPPHRGELLLAGSVICYRPYECADGWVTLGALEPKFWQAWCRGVEREELIERQFEAPGSDAHAQVVAIFKTRTRAQWEQFAREHDCCLEPVLELDEALDSELVRAREMVVNLQQPGVEGGVRQLGVPVKLERTPGTHDRLPGPALGEHTEEVLAAARLLRRGDRRAAGVGRGCRSRPPRRYGGAGRHVPGVELLQARRPKLPVSRLAASPSRASQSVVVGLPPRAVVLHHAHAVRQLDTAGERAAEGPKRRTVVASHQQQVLATAALCLGGEAQPRAVG